MNLLALVLALTPCQAEPVITHNFGMMRGDLLVEAVAKEAGQSWKGTGGLKGELIYANLKDLPASKAKKALAEVVGGRWKSRDGVEVLTSPENELYPFQGELAKAIRTYFANTAVPPPLSRADIDALIRRSVEMDQDRPDSAANQDIRKIAKESPTSRALTKLALALGEEFFLGLRPGERIVFSENPTEVQSPLPPGARTAFADLRNELPYFTRAVLAAKHKNPEKESIFGSEFEREELLSRLGPMCIILTQEELFTQATLSIYDLTGKSVIHSETDFVGMDPGAFMAAASGMASQTDADPFAAYKDQIEVSSEGRKRLDWLRDPVTLPTNENRKPKQEAIDLIANMDWVEPLSVLFSEPLDSFCSKYNQGMIAVVPDLVLGMPLMDPREGDENKMSYADLLRFVGGAWLTPHACTAEVVDGNLVVASSTASLGRTSRFNRAATAKLAKELAAGRSQIEALAEFALKSTSPMMAMGACQITAAALGARIQLTNGASLEALRIYGSLNEAQRLQAQRGGIRLGLATLQPQAQLSARRLIFGWNPWVEPDSQSDPARGRNEETETAAGPMNEPYDADDMRIAQMMSTRISSNPDEEVTLVLGNGPPLGTSIDIKVDRNARIFGYASKSNYSALSLVTPSQLAYQTAFAESDPSERSATFDRFVIGAQEILSVEFVFPKAGKMLRGFVGESIDPKASYFGADALPAEFRERYAKALKEVKEQATKSGLPTSPPRGRIHPP